MAQVDYVLVVEKDMRASETDNLFCPLPQVTACSRTRTRLFGSGRRSAPRYFSYYFTRQIRRRHQPDIGPMTSETPGRQIPRRSPSI